LFLDLLTDGVGVTGTVSKHKGIGRYGLQQGLGGAAVRCLADCQLESVGGGGNICQRVDLGRASSTADAERGSKSGLPSASIKSAAAP